MVRVFLAALVASVYAAAPAYDGSSVCKTTRCVYLKGTTTVFEKRSNGLKERWHW
jgi:hypothetical protein